MNLINLYKQILDALKCSYDENGKIYLLDITPLNNEPVPVKITLKTGRVGELHLPIQEALQSKNQDEKIYFHPAQELHTYKHQSEIISWMQERCSTVVIFSAIHLLNVLLEIIYKPEIHDTLSIKQKKLIEGLPTSKAFYEHVNRIMKHVTNKGVVTSEEKLMFFHLFPLKDIDGVKYKTTCKLTTILEKDDLKFGVQVSDNVLKQIRVLLGRLLPTGIQEGCNSLHQPYLKVLLDTYYIVATHFNELKKTLKVNPNNDLSGISYFIPTDYNNDFSDINKFYTEAKSIQMYLEGNRGFKEETANENIITPSITIPQMTQPETIIKSQPFIQQPINQPSSQQFNNQTPIQRFNQNDKPLNPIDAMIANNLSKALAQGSIHQQTNTRQFNQNDFSRQFMQPQPSQFQQPMVNGYNNINPPWNEPATGLINSVLRNNFR